MDPNQPDIAREVGSRALSSDSGSEAHATPSNLIDECHEPLIIPQSSGSPSQKLPALQNSTSPLHDSPAQERHLPSFRHFNELAMAAISEEETSDDWFLRAGQHLLLFNNNRRPSQASDNGPYSADPRLASIINESYQSSDGLSLSPPQSAPIESRAHRIDTDGLLTSRTLPPPARPNIQHIPSHGSGGFKCEHPDCTAPPFLTQYLLK